MNDTMKVLNDVAQFMGQPLFTIGSTGISINRMLLTMILILAVIRVAGFTDRALQRVAARRPQQFSVASAYALGRIARYLLLIVGLVLILETAGVRLSTLAVLGGGLGIGIGFGLDTRSKYNSCNAAGVECSADRRDSIRHLALAADAGFFVAIAGAIATGIIYTGSSESPHVMVQPSPTGIAIGAQGRF